MKCLSTHGPMFTLLIVDCAGHITYRATRKALSTLSCRAEYDFLLCSLNHSASTCRPALAPSTKSIQFY